MTTGRIATKPLHIRAYLLNGALPGPGTVCD
jgi:hypothetical protein